MNLSKRLLFGFVTACLLMKAAVLFAAPPASSPSRTGQTTCYSRDGRPMACPGSGMDGEDQRGTIWTSPRFIDNGNGTVTDTTTRLTWLKNAGCYSRLAWKDALFAATMLANGNCGLTDSSTAGSWRMPNLNELLTLSNADLPVAGTIAWLGSFGFQNVTTGNYWSSTTAADRRETAWGVGVAGSGTVKFDKYSSALLWVVKGGALQPPIATAGAAGMPNNPCYGCHSPSASVVSGGNVNSEWQVSTHSTRSGATCMSCHEPQNHPTNLCSTCHNGGQVLGSACEIQRNPDKTGKCLKCHNGQNLIDPAGVDKGYHGSLNPSAYAGILLNSQRAHFNNLSGSGYPASFVSSNYLYRQGVSSGGCRKCHNPHDTTSTLQYNRDWARAGHGSTAALMPTSYFHYFRDASFSAYDYKTAGSYNNASQVMSDSTNATFQSCVRCHTTTGYINYVSSGFASLKPFAGPGYPVMTTDAAIAANPTVDRSRISPDRTKELINCNACHDDGSGNAYNYKLRKVPPVTVYYNYSSKLGITMSGGAIRGFALTFPDAGASNMCIVCHSGYRGGIDIKMADARGLDLTKPSRMVNHFRAAAQMMFRPIDKNGNSIGMAFEFYSSGSNKLQNYANVQFTHDIIGTAKTNPNRPDIGTGMTADSRGYGPCIGCHMNIKDSMKSVQTSHTFLPVNREASATYRSDFANSSDPITGTVSKACAACHLDEFDVSSVDGVTGTTANLLDVERQRYKAAVKAFARLLAFAVDSRLPTAADIASPLAPSNLSTASNRVWSDPEGRVPTPANWYGSNTTGIRLQPWLRSATSSGGALPTATLVNSSSATGLDYYVLGAQFVDPLTGSTYPIRNASYTMGAVFNWYMFYYDPGAFAHNRRYAKRIMYDSMDWLDDGKLNKSVCDQVTVFSAYPSGTYRTLNTYGGIGLAGVNDTFSYSTYLTTDELKQASYYLCRSLSTTDHRPAP